MKQPSGYALIRRHLRRYPRILRQHLLRELSHLVAYEPVIGIMGKTGVGKSSLCNALFRSQVCAINAVEACTRQPQRVRLRFGSHYLTLVDLPGVGESISRDDEYRELYRELMPQLDMVLWVLKADDRAFSVEEHFIRGYSHNTADYSHLCCGSSTRLIKPNRLNSGTGCQHNLQYHRVSILRRSVRPSPVRWEQQRRIFFRCQSGGGTTCPVWWRR